MEEVIRSNALNAAIPNLEEELELAVSLIPRANPAVKTKRLNLFRHVDRGMLKVLWSTAQILSTISWNLALHFPAPFSDMLTTLSFSELDFSSLDCYVTSVDLVSRVYFASLIPLALVAVDVLVRSPPKD